MAERRIIVFQDLAEVMPEVERLVAGHSPAGNWSLAQICHHLGTTIRLTARPVPEAGVPTAQQATLRDGFFGLGAFPNGRASPAPFVPPEGLDLAKEAAALGDAIKRFATAQGPFPAHPMLGPLTGDQWHRFHTMHAAHHLGFVVPA
ncbi:MAG TPA: DUF1569 domain-containing protein [Pirellulales bacterium]